MASSTHWTSKQYKNFITLLREHALLWDTQHPDFINRRKREMTWSVIHTQTNLPITEMKTNLCIFRKKYCVEYKKMLEDSSYKSTWRYFKDIKFLFKHDDDENDDLRPYTKEEQLTDGTKSDTNSYAAFEYENTNVDETQLNEYNYADYKENTHEQDEFTIFGQRIANELRFINNFKSVKLAFKCKVMTAILEANEALIRHKVK